MPDTARDKTDKILIDIEERIEKEYTQAKNEIEEKLSKHLERFAVKDAEKRTALNAGEITKQEYNQWRSGQFMTGERWKDLRNTIAEDLVNKQAIAKSITNGYMPEVYALNHNFVAETVSNDLDFNITFSLYDKNAVENLMKHNDILPPPGKRMNAKFARGEAVKWERGQIQSVTMQSILQGESIPKMSKRIAQTLSVRNRADSIRYARTACTGAENKGRLDGMRHLEEDGLVLHKQWTATGDDRTRNSHLDIDGESVPPNEEFSNGLMYPGDPGGSADEVWNCRCSMGTIVIGFRRKDGSISYVDYERDEDQHDREIAAERARRLSENGIGNVSKPYTETINAYQKLVEQNGLTTEYVMDAGKALQDELNPAYEKAKIENEEAKKANQDAYEKYLEACNQYDKIANERYKNVDIMLDQNYLDRLQKAEQKRTDARVALNSTSEALMAARFDGNKSAELLAEKLSKIRDIGYTNDIKFKQHLNNSRSPIRKNVEYAYSKYPTSWVQKSMEAGWLKIGKTNRGYYEHLGGYGELKISGMSEQSMNATAFHELGHRFEYTIPGIRKQESQFYKKRTDGEESKWLGSGYGKREVTKKDDFIDAYMGKDYGDNTYELVSMGFEYAYTNPLELARDPDMQRWILGLLALVP